MLDIDKAKSDTKLISEEVNENVMEHILAGIEIISGRARGSHYLNVSNEFLSSVIKKVLDHNFYLWFEKSSYIFNTK